LSPILSGPENGGCADYLIVVEPQGPPRTHGFGRIVVVMPLELGRPPVLTMRFEALGIAAGDREEIEIDVFRALRGDVEKNQPNLVDLGRMQEAVGLPSANDFIRRTGDVD